MLCLKGFNPFKHDKFGPGKICKKNLFTINVSFVLNKHKKMKRNFRPKLKKQVDNTKKDTIVLKHEEDKPFGPLRNDYKSDLYIDGKRWQ